MRDAAGELADRLHLLRLPQRLLRLHELARAFLDTLFEGGVEFGQSLRRLPLIVNVGIGAHPAHNLVAGVADRRRARDVPPIGAVTAQQSELHLIGFASAHRRRPSRRRFGDVAGMHERAPSLDPKRASLAAEIGQHAIIEPVEPAVGLRRPRLIGHGAGQHAEILLA